MADRILLQKYVTMGFISLIIVHGSTEEKLDGRTNGNMPPMEEYN